MTNSMRNLKNDQEMHYFFPKRLAKSMRELSVDFIQTEHQRIKSRWFHSDDDADLFLWSDESGNIIKQQINLCGQVVEWNIVNGLRSGFVMEKEVSTPGAPFSEEVIFDKVTSQSALSQAKDLIQELSVIDEKTKNILIYNLNEAPTISKMDSEVFMKSFGALSNFNKPIISRKNIQEQGFIRAIRGYLLSYVVACFLLLRGFFKK